MATAKWGSLGTRTALTLSGVNSLANGGASGLMTYDNSSNRDIQALVEVALGSFTSTTGATITLVAYLTGNAGAVINDDTGLLGGGFWRETRPITVGASAKAEVFWVRLAPVSMRFQLINNAGAALASSNNSINVTPHNEDVS